MKFLCLGICSLSLLCACVNSRPDHFYVLEALPALNTARAAPSVQVSLNVTLPSAVDRPQMVLNTSANGIVVLEHERWAAPLPDLVLQTLARDIERRRGDVMVSDRRIDRPGVASTKVAVDIVHLSMREGGSASLEAQWRIVDAHGGAEVAGRNTFSAPLAQSGHAAVAQALSQCLGQLADSLVAQLPGA